MPSETRICQNCKNPFTIEVDDFAFYKKINVPPPTLCPQCRRQRRLAWRNDLNLYSRTCGLCKKSIVSLYSTDKPFPVYCQRCWWSDQWNPKAYGRDFDFSRPFFEQFKELQNTVPALALINDDGIASENCEYTQDFSFGKNCYMVFIAWRLEDVLYSYGIKQVKDVADCLFLFDGGQRIYEGVFSEKCYNSRYIYNSVSLTDCAFCFDCRDCQNCFLSVGLRHKKYCIRNQQYTKEEYEKVLRGYRLDTYSGVEKAKKEFWEFALRYPRRFATLKNCVNCTGDYLLYSKNSHHCFNVDHIEDCKYWERGDAPKDCYDSFVGGECSQCYEGLTPDQSYRNLFGMYSWTSTEITYTDSCHSSKYLFGCVGLKKAQHSILNKQYTKEDYEAFVHKIVEHMKKTGEWGEFFPVHLSKFGYNESVAQEYYPFSRDEAVRKGFLWQDHPQFTTGKETIQLDRLPDGIDQVPDSITDEILVCVGCGRNYKIVPAELKFYRGMKIPIPRKCFYCRNRDRFSIKTPDNLWHRKCTCGGNKSDNGIYQNQTTHFHGVAPCPNEFETTYAPDRPEIVYCEQCYQSEVV